MRVVWAFFLLLSLAAAKGHRPPPVAAEPTGDASLTLTCSPAGADVFIDGELVSKAPIELPVPVAVGSHTVKVVKLGYAPFIDVISTKGRRAIKLEVELVPVSGVLHVDSTVPGSRVLVDGRFVGVTPLDVEFDVGARAIQVEKGCYKEFFKNVLAVAGKEAALEVQLEALPDGVNPCIAKPAEAPKWYQKRWVWGVVAGAAVVAAGAVTAGILARPSDPLAGADVRYDLSTAH